MKPTRFEARSTNRFGERRPERAETLRADFEPTTYARAIMTRARVRSFFRLVAGLGVALLLCGCETGEKEGMSQTGRYVFEATELGFEVRERAGPLARLIALVLGRQPEPKIRVGHAVRGANAFEPHDIARVLVRKRSVRGPEIKSPFKRPWEVRFVDPTERELSPFFYFRAQTEAEAFANQVRRLVSGLLHPSEGRVAPAALPDSP